MITKLWVYRIKVKTFNFVTTFWNIQESEDKKYYIGEIQWDPDVRFNLDRENLSIVYRLYEEIDITGQCTILTTDISFEDHIKLHYMIRVQQILRV